MKTGERKLGNVWLVRAQIAVSAIGLMTGAGCVAVNSSAQVGDTTAQVVIPNDVMPDHTGSDRPALCDPFGHEDNATTDQGLVAQMYYAGDACTTENTAQCVHYSQVGDYIKNSIHLDADIIFNRLDVPTRPYDGGISWADQSPILSPSGNTLYEWFALSFDSVIKLGPNDPAGKYQLAVLADDGAILSLDTGSGPQQWINNDGLHPSTLICANKTLHLDANSAIPMHLDYFQGPRYHIALVLAWRHIPDNVDEIQNPSALSDGACGQQGNGTFFDSTKTPSAPMPTWLNFLSRGWSVLTPENYALPASRFTNPCPNSDGGCFTDTYTKPKGNAFALSEMGIDPKSFKVMADGRPIAFTYDPALNRVVIPNLSQSAMLVKIGYCKTVAPAPTPSPTPTPTPTFTPPPSS